MLGAVVENKFRDYFYPNNPLRICKLEDHDLSTAHGTPMCSKVTVLVRKY